ncbi:hypothetical protein M514_08506 [Trichuris suis]|uniref:Uncharacterized protein n=1 Tax=Trichuris suis TaxID=68888 RepID=A0A085MVM6_9BILA|nr:hypothetical protein M513_08506 [Trichuris suis]KFD61272.1 hypothetical protein M514_08506 [Trichuris suis]KHJ40515.1 hypothetical protein D918_09405 [Trichuris suis]
MECPPRQSVACLALNAEFSFGQKSLRDAAEQAAKQLSWTSCVQWMPMTMWLSIGNAERLMLMILFLLAVLSNPRNGDQ